MLKLQLDVERVWWQWDSTFQSGEIWHVGPDQTMTRWWTVSQAPVNKGGKRRHLTQWRTNSWLGMSGPLLDPLNKLSFVPSKVPWRDFRSLACPSPWSRGFNQRSSGFCSSVAFGNLCPCLRSPADVADHLILVAIIAQRVRWQECWGAEDFRWRTQPLAREAGGRVTTNVRVQDMDLLPLCSGVRSSPSIPRRDCSMSVTVSGAALDQARRRKERTYPELAKQHGRARLVVLGCEVGGRWSEESRQFLASLAAAKARSEPELMRKSTMFCWLRRWCTLMACTAARAFSLSLLERRCCAADGSTPPTAEVVADHFRDVE